jgi:uncharacterized protein YbbC (DUF1343 family)
MPKSEFDTGWTGYDIGMSGVQTGLEVLVETPELVGGRRWALLANQAAVTADLDSARGVLRAAKVGELIRLFAPEHGLDGVAQDMEAVGDRQDSVTCVEVRSLYGADRGTLAPRSEDLDDVDVLVVDLPDIGTRYYTFAATMDLAMAAAERAGVEVVVADRPNPIGGVLREGGPVEPGFESFVSQLPVPVRHGLTLAEISLLLRRERYPDLELTVVPSRGWQREMWWDSTGLPWVPPSPNMPTLETATLYPGLCLIEATTLSEGRGTTRPFHLVGAPWVAAERLVGELRRLNLSGIAFRPTRFRPEFGKHAGSVCSGIELHITDRRLLEPLALGVHILKAIRDLHPEDFQWRPEPYEFVSDVPAIDLLTGSEDARLAIEGQGSLDTTLEGWSAAAAEFAEGLGGVLLYHS